MIYTYNISIKLIFQIDRLRYMHTIYYDICTKYITIYTHNIHMFEFLMESYYDIHASYTNIHNYFRFIRKKFSNI